VFAHGDQIARAVGLDMAAAGWKPTVDAYLGRVPKARILEAVREAKGEHSAQLIDHQKKAEMAKEAERLQDGTGWLPEPLRLANAETVTDEPTAVAEALPDFLAGEEDDTGAPDLEGPEPHAIAAE
jgi:ParB family chromosome partitioning protein